MQNYKVFYALKMLRTEFFARFQNVDSLAFLICQVLYCLDILIQDQQSCPKNGNETEVNLRGENIKVGISRQILSG